MAQNVVCVLCAVIHLVERGYCWWLLVSVKQLIKTSAFCCGEGHLDFLCFIFVALYAFLIGHFLGGLENTVVYLAWRLSSRL